MRASKHNANAILRIAKEGTAKRISLSTARTSSDCCHACAKISSVLRKVENHESKYPELVSVTPLSTHVIVTFHR